MDFKVLIFLAALFLNVFCERQICDKVRCMHSNPFNETLNISLDVSHEIVNGYYPIWKIQVSNISENHQNEDIILSSIFMNVETFEFHTNRSSLLIVKGTNVIQNIRAHSFDSYHLAEIAVYFINGSFVMQDGMPLNMSQPTFEYKLFHDGKVYPISCTCLSFKNVTEELVIPRCKIFKSESLIFTNPNKTEFKTVNTTYEMLPTCMKTSSVHNVNHLYMEMDEWINCTSTPTTLNCFAQFPMLRDPIVLSEFMSYKIESDGRLNTNKFLYAEIDNFINETKIIGGIPYNENCVHLNNPYESRKYIISTTLCCQEYF